MHRGLLEVGVGRGSSIADTAENKCPLVKINEKIEGAQDNRWIR